MQTNTIQSTDRNRCRQILDSIPAIVFIVDHDVRILDWNSTAEKALGLLSETTLHLRGGQLLNCIHHFEVQAGCGHAPACADCVIRGSVKAAIAGQKSERRRTAAELRSAEGVKCIDLLITATPLADSGNAEVLLIMEDISELIRVRSLLPICASCKSIRNDEQYWQSVEQYFRETAGIDFSHGVCPTCLTKYYPETARRLEAKKAAC